MSAHQSGSWRGKGKTEVKDDRLAWALDAGPECVKHLRVTLASLHPRGLRSKTLFAGVNLTPVPALPSVSKGSSRRKNQALLYSNLLCDSGKAHDSLWAQVSPSGQGKGLELGMQGLRLGGASKSLLPHPPALRH